jgi:integrase
MKPRRLVVVRFRQDRQRWEVDFQNPPGSTYRRTRRVFGSEEEALAYAAMMAPRLDATAPPVQDQTMTLGAAFNRYFQARARKRSIDRDRASARYLLAEFGESTRLRDLSASRIARYKERRLTGGSIRHKCADGTPRPLSPASINRPLGLLLSLLRLAHREWEVLPRVPVIRLEREPEGRLRWLEPDELHRLLDTCRASRTAFLADLVLVAHETGMRLGEIMGLTWDRVDLSRGVIRLEVTKSGHRREIPMRDTVYAVLAAMPEPRSGRVWPVASFRDAFVAAVERAGLEGFRFHDLRHSFASHWMMNGGSLLTLSKVLGHASVAMTQRYSHLSPSHIRDEMERTAHPLEPIAGTRTLEHAQVPGPKGVRRLATVDTAPTRAAGGKRRA